MYVTDPSEMSISDIKKELSVRCFENLDCTIDESYRSWLTFRIDFLLSELDKRKNIN